MFTQGTIRVACFGGLLSVVRSALSVAYVFSGSVCPNWIPVCPRAYDRSPNSGVSLMYNLVWTNRLRTTDN